MNLALPNVKGDLFVLDQALFAEGIAASRTNPRKRMILPIHRNQDDLVQRMLNFFQPGTYVKPHLHPLECASETIFTIQGALGFITMDEHGEILATVRLEQGGLLDIVPGVWHAMVALEPDTAILEIKRGPYNEHDKHFAPWAPKEDSPGSIDLLKGYEALFITSEHKNIKKY